MFPLEMGRLIGILYIFGAVLVGLLGAIIPSHFGAVDRVVLEHLGASSAGIEQLAIPLLEQKHFGRAEFIQIALRRVGSTNVGVLDGIMSALRKQNPDELCHGGPAPYLAWMEKEAGLRLSSQSNTKCTVADFFLAGELRKAASQLVQESRDPTVLEVLKTRFLTHTTIFPPAVTEAGQPLEAAVLITAVLAYENSLDAQFRLQLEEMAAAANRGRFTGPLEAVYLDILSLSQICNWDQLAGLMQMIPDPESLRRITYFVLRDPDREGCLAILYTCSLIGGGRQVAQYLHKYGAEGLEVLEQTLRLGIQPVGLLLESQLLPFRYAWVEGLSNFDGLRNWSRWMIALTAKARWVALFLKYWLWFNASFLLARGIGFVTFPPEGDLISAIRLQRQFIGAVLILGLVILAAEPYFREKVSEPTIPQGWAWPRVKVELKSIEEVIRRPMDEKSWIAMAVFLIVQLALHVVGLLKLREIKRQPVAPELKLRLLDNEEHLFDAGLYVGLFGTVLGLLLMVMKVLNLAPVVAYSSTLFGILFVSLLKICYVRPYRRSLLLAQGKCEQ